MQYSPPIQTNNVIKTVYNNSDYNYNDITDVSSSSMMSTYVSTIKPSQIVNLSTDNLILGPLATTENLLDCSNDQILSSSSIKSFSNIKLDSNLNIFSSTTALSLPTINQPGYLVPVTNRISATIVNWTWTTIGKFNITNYGVYLMTCTFTLYSATGGTINDMLYNLDDLNSFSWQKSGGVNIMPAGGSISFDIEYVRYTNLPHVIRVIIQVGSSGVSCNSTLADFKCVRIA